MAARRAEAKAHVLPQHTGGNAGKILFRVEADESRVGGQMLAETQHMARGRFFRSFLQHGESFDVAVDDGDAAL